jgi:hypothetical protein
MIGIVVVLIVDGIQSFKLGLHNLEISLSAIRTELDDAVQDAKTSQKDTDPQKKLREQETFLRRTETHDNANLFQEAREVGQAMKMLRHIFITYKD